MKLLQELKNFDYPLDQCLKLCKEHSMNEATAFLLERTGAVLEALILYLQVFFFKKKNNNNNNTKRFSKKIFKKRYERLKKERISVISSLIYG